MSNASSRQAVAAKPQAARAVVSPEWWRRATPPGGESTQTIATLEAGGQPQTRFGHDFARMRVHGDAPVCRHTVVEGSGTDEAKTAKQADVGPDPAPAETAAPTARVAFGPNGVGIQPMSWAALQALPAHRGVRISGPPVGKTLADISAGGGVGAAGYTDWPSGYKAPDFEFNTSKSGSDWTAKPTLKTAAFEGTSGSFFTSAGKHKTTFQESGKDVFWNFSAAISTLVKQGEQEHCDDFAEAYKISLKEAEDVLNNHIVGKSFGPKASKTDAQNLVLTEIGSKLTHAGLGNDKTKWASTYDTLFTKTLVRDNSGWHSISKGARSVDGAGNVVYEIVKGSSQIGSHASNTIIKY